MDSYLWRRKMTEVLMNKSIPEYRHTYINTYILVSRNFIWAIYVYVHLFIYSFIYFTLLYVLFYLYITPLTYFFISTFLTSFFLCGYTLIWWAGLNSIWSTIRVVWSPSKAFMLQLCKRAKVLTVSSEDVSGECDSRWHHGVMQL